MIKAHCFEKPWIDAFKAKDEYRRLNPPVLEKMIKALYLLQLLKKSDCNFVFKGGTSLVLILNTARRFSVDIDIITRHSKEEIEACLQWVVESSNFAGWHLDEHRSYKEGIPKAHYELEYSSKINKDASYIQLDILFEDSQYPKLQEKQVVSPWIETEEIITIVVPTVESILGDKLTAFAPETTGIPFGKGKETEIIKQLFDIGHLFDEAKDMQEVNSSFHAFVAKEIDYRKLTIGAREVLWDIIETSKLISIGARLKGDHPARNNYERLIKSLRAFENFLTAGHFRIDDSILASAKASYLASNILAGNQGQLEKYAKQGIADLDITSADWNALNRLKRMPEAYFYWNKTLTLLNLAAPMFPIAKILTAQ